MNLRSLLIGWGFLAIIFISGQADSAEKVMPSTDIQILKSAHKNGVEQALSGVKGRAMSKDMAEILEVLYLIQHASTIELGRADKILERHPWVKNAFGVRLANLINTKRSAEEIVQWFNKYKPISARENILYLSALLSMKQSVEKQREYQKSIADIWSGHVFSQEIEAQIHHLVPTFPLPAIKSKINLLFWHDAKKPQIIVLLKLLPKQDRIIYDNRLQAMSSPKLIDKLAQKSTDDFLLYLNAKALLKAEQEDKALKLLLSIKTTPTNGPAVWKLRNIAIRNAMRDKKYKQALSLTANNSGLSGADAVEVEWLAGFISLRFMNQPKEASDHFRKMLAHAQFSSSKAQASYWLGRSFAAMDDDKNSRFWFEYTVSNFPFCFYGQIATLELPHGMHRQLYIMQPVPEIVQSSPPVDVTKLLLIAKMLFMSGFKDEAHVMLHYFAAQHLISVEEASKAIQDYNKNNLHSLAVMFSKYLSNHGYPILPDSYPLHLNKKIHGHNHNTAFYLAIIRQESGFDQWAVSSAGAIGLMQLMPGTAHRYAAKLGLQQKAYITDLNSNIAKGSAYLDDLMRKWDNNRILSIASYNAGEGAVAKWIAIYGDPRTMQSFYAIMDWIELVPYLETRFYIKKVMENMINYETLVFQETVEDHEMLQFFSAENMNSKT